MLHEMLAGFVGSTKKAIRQLPLSPPSIRLILPNRRKILLACFSHDTGQESQTLCRQRLPGLRFCYPGKHPKASSGRTSSCVFWFSSGLFFP
jgi:hypothetical protein